MNTKGGVTVLQHRKRRLLVPVIISISFCLMFATLLISFSGPPSKVAHAAQPAGSSSQVNRMLTNGRSEPSFAGKILHWTQTTYNYTPNGPDPANGKAINGDIWVAVGDDGLPMSIHVRYTLANGAFLQEFVQTRQGATFFFNSAYHMPTGCSVDNRASSPEALLSALPRFVQESLLPAQHYAKVSKKLAYPQPVTESLSKGTPLQIYGSGTNVHSWLFSKTLASGMKQSDALDVNVDGRLLAEEVKVFNAQGNLTQDAWETYGQLQVYSSSDVAAAMLVPTQKGECHA